MSDTSAILKEYHAVMVKYSSLLERKAETERLIGEAAKEANRVRGELFRASGITP